MRAVAITIFLLISINLLSGCAPCGHPVGCALAPVAYAVAVPVTAIKEGIQEEIKDSLNEDRARRASEAARAGDEIWESEILEAKSELSRLQQVDELGDFQEKDPEERVNSIATRIGILTPEFNNPTMPSNSVLEDELNSEVLAFVGSSPTFELIYDYSSRNKATNISSDYVWRGSAVRKRPDIGKLRAIGSQLDADCLVFGWLMNVMGWARVDLYAYETNTEQLNHREFELRAARSQMARVLSTCERRSVSIH